MAPKKQAKINEPQKTQTPASKSPVPSKQQANENAENRKEVSKSPAPTKQQGKKGKNQKTQEEVPQSPALSAQNTNENQEEIEKSSVVASEVAAESVDNNPWRMIFDQCNGLNKYVESLDDFQTQIQTQNAQQQQNINNFHLLLEKLKPQIEFVQNESQVELQKQEQKFQELLQEKDIEIQKLQIKYEAIIQEKDAEINTHIQKEKQLEDQIQGLQNDRNEKIQEIQNLQNQIQERIQEIKNLQTAISEKDVEVKRFEGVIQELEIKTKDAVDKHQEIAGILNKEQIAAGYEELWQKINVNNQQIEEQKKQFQEITKEKENVQKEVASLNQKNAQIQTQVEQSLQKIQAGEQQIKELQNQLAESKKQFSDTQTQLSQTQKQFQDQQKSNQDSQNKISESQKQLSESQKLLAESKEQTKKLDEEFQKEKTEKEAEIQNLKKQNEETTTKIQQLEKKIQDNQTQMSALQKTSEQQKASIQQKDAEIENQKKEVQNANGKLNAQIKQTKDKETQNADLTKKLNEQVQTSDALKKSLEESQKQSEDLQNQKNALEEEIKGLNEKIVNLDTQLSENQKKFEELQLASDTQIKQLQQELQDLNNVKETLESDLQNQKNQNQDIEQQIQAAQEKNLLMCENIDDLNQNLDYCKDEIVSRDDIIKQQESSIQQLKYTEILGEKLQIENNLLKQRLSGQMPDEQIMQQINALAYEKQELLKQIEDFQKRIEILENENKSFLEDKLKIQQYDELWDSRQKDQSLIRNLNQKIRELEQNIPNKEQPKKKEDQLAKDLENLIVLERKQILEQNLLLKVLDSSKSEQPMPYLTVFEYSEKCLEEKFEEDQQDIIAGVSLKSFPQFLVNYFLTQVGTVTLANKNIAQYLKGLEISFTQNNEFAKLMARMLQIYDQNPFNDYLSCFLVKANKLFTNIIKQYQEKAQKKAESQIQGFSLDNAQNSENGGYINCIDAFNLVYHIFSKYPDLCNQVLYALGENQRNQEGSQLIFGCFQQPACSQRRTLQTFTLQIICWKLVKLGRSPKQLFNSIDINQKGFLSADQFIELIQEKLKPWISQEEAQTIVNVVQGKDYNITCQNFISQVNFYSTKIRGKKTSLVSKCHFLNSLARVYEGKRITDDKILKQIFLEQDYDKSGTFELGEFWEFVLKIDQNCSKQKAIDMFQQSIRKSQLPDPDAISPEAFSLVAAENNLGGFGIKPFENKDELKHIKPVKLNI